MNDNNAILRDRARASINEVLDSHEELEVFHTRAMARVNDMLLNPDRLPVYVIDHLNAIKRLGEG